MLANAFFMVFTKYCVADMATLMVMHTSGIVMSMLPHVYATCISFTLKQMSTNLIAMPIRADAM